MVQVKANNIILKYTVLFLLSFLLVVSFSVKAEYGDIVLNESSESEGMPPVVFPHWFHRIRFRCKVCHYDLGFKFTSGKSGINMLSIIDGQFCGACHDGGMAWSVENCELCHTGKKGMATQVHGDTLNKIIIPEKKSPGK